MKESIESYKERLVVVLKTYKKAIVRGYDILLEYSESQKCFHFNYLDGKGVLYDEPSPCFMPIGYTDERTFVLFKEWLEGERGTIDDMITKYNTFYD